MPELPEVETVVEGLRPNLVGKTILSADVFNENTIKNPKQVDDFQKQLSGKKITEVNRRGKYIVILLDGSCHLIIHLRMTGQLIYSQNPLKLGHLRVAFKLSAGGLYFNDIRKFGTISLLSRDDLSCEKGYYSLGVEPLSSELNIDYLKSKIKGNKPVKNFILDQTVMAGLGNIYADESLFLAKIRPNRPVNDLSDQELRVLIESIKKILATSINNRGTTFSDYVDSYGGKGSNQNYLKVYGRAKKECLSCNSLLEKCKVAGRTTVFCLNCQK